MATPTLKAVNPSVPESSLALAPEPVVIYGLAGGVTPQPAPAIDASPADATAVATDLQALVTALQAAGVLT